MCGHFFFLFFNKMPNLGSFSLFEMVALGFDSWPSVVAMASATARLGVFISQKHSINRVSNEFVENCLVNKVTEYSVAVVEAGMMIWYSLWQCRYEWRCSNTKMWFKFNFQYYYISRLHRWLMICYYFAKMPILPKCLAPVQEAITGPLSSDLYSGNLDSTYYLAIALHIGINIDNNKRIISSFNSSTLCRIFLQTNLEYKLA